MASADLDPAAVEAATVPCTCGAKPGEPCYVDADGPWFHAERVNVARDQRERADCPTCGDAVFAPLVAELAEARASLEREKTRALLAESLRDEALARAEARADSGNPTYLGNVATYWKDRAIAADSSLAEVEIQRAWAESGLSTARQALEEVGRWLSMGDITGYEVVVASIEDTLSRLAGTPEQETP